MARTTNDILDQLWLKDNQSLADEIGAKYHTVATWRYQYFNGKLTEEKKAEILSKFKYQLKSERTWVRSRVQK